MNLFQALKFWVIQKLVGQQLQEIMMPRPGRSSEETFENGISGLRIFVDGLTPIVPPETIEICGKLAVFNPAINHAIQSVTSLANNGHELQVSLAFSQKRGEAVIAAAQERLNFQAKNLYQLSAGVDGLINHYLEQIMVTGAISSEDVIAADLSGVEKVVTVPTRQIRFKWENGKYQPYQKIDGAIFSGSDAMVKLSDITYKYFALRTYENAPYAIPLFVSALEPLATHRDMQKNISFIMRKLGFLGLVYVALTPPPKNAGEQPNEYSTRKRSYLDQAFTWWAKNFYQGLGVGYSDQEIKHFNVTGDARGAKDIMEVIETIIANGLGLDPLFIGRAFNTTETFANVSYRFMVGQAEKIRRLAKRRMEATYNLDLLLQGIPAEVTFSFNAQPARDPLAEAEAELMEQTMRIERAKVGMVDPDVAAQEQGYDEWFDPSLLHIGEQTGSIVSDGTGENMADSELQARMIIPLAAKSAAGSPLGWRTQYRFKFSQAMNSYRFVRENLGRVRTSFGDILRSANGIDRSLQRGTIINLVSEKKVNEILAKWSERYWNDIEPFFEGGREEALKAVRSFLASHEVTDFVDAEDFAEQLYMRITEMQLDNFRGREAQRAIRKAVRETYEFFRLEDVSAFAKKPAIEFALDVIDERALRFFKNIDDFFLSKIPLNETTRDSLKPFLEKEYLEKAGNLFGRIDPKTVKEFTDLASSKLRQLNEYEGRRIINTSVQRMRTWGQVGQLNEAGFEYAEIFNPAPDSEICQFMNGKIIPVGPAREAIAELSALSAEEFQQRLEPITPGLITAKGIEAATADGQGFPPYHPNCKTRVLASAKSPSTANNAAGSPLGNGTVLSREKMLKWLLCGMRLRDGMRTSGGHKERGRPLQGDTIGGNGHHEKLKESIL